MKLQIWIYCRRCDRVLHFACTQPRDVEHELAVCPTCGQKWRLRCVPGTLEVLDDGGVPDPSHPPH